MKRNIDDTSALPSWTRMTEDAVDHRGLWALGMETVALGMEARLFSGFTGTTVYTRYYSFFCWVFLTLREYAAKHNRTITPKLQEAWITRLENALRSATLDASPEIGQLIGVTDAIRVNEMKDSQFIDLSRKGAATAFSPAQYSASFLALGLGGPVPPSRAIRLTVLAEKAGRAFDQTVREALPRESDRDLLLSEESRVPVRVIRRLKTALAIRRVKPSEPEHEPLVDVLFRLREESEDPLSQRLRDRARSRALSLLLEIAEQSEGRVKDHRLIRRLLTSRCFPDGDRFRVSPPFEADFEQLCAYQRRQQVKLGMYAFWWAVTERLESAVDRSASTSELLTGVRSHIAASAVAREWLGRRPLELTVREAIRSVKKHCNGLDQRRAAPAFDLSEAIEFRSDAPDSERIGAGLVLLLLSVLEFQDLSGNENVLRRASDEGGRKRLSLAAFAGDTDARAGMSIGDYLAWITTSCVLAQSLEVATAKLRRGEFRYFVVRDDNGYQRVRRQRPNSFLIYDGTRIRSGYYLLEDLDLVSLNSGLRITRAGKSVLERSRAHHESLLV
jgi:hypothetical protein